MGIVTVSESPVQRVLPASSVPEAATGWREKAEPADTSDAAAGYDATLLLAALEDIASEQAAIEWLLEADLLRACLVC